MYYSYISNRLIILFPTSVIADKDGYVMTGADANGVFLAHKLAEIIVQVSDQADNASLQVHIFGYIIRKRTKLMIFYMSKPFYSSHRVSSFLYLAEKVIVGTA